MQQQKRCEDTICLQRMWTLRLQRLYEYDFTCDTCKNKDETHEFDKLCCFPNSSSSSNHFIIFTSMNTEMNIEHNRVHIRYRANGNHVIVICHCYISLSFQ